MKNDRGKKGGKVAFVAGGAGDGFRALCTALAEKGYDVSFTCDDTNAAETLAADMEKNGVVAMPTPVSEYSSEELSSAIVETAERMGGIDLLAYMGELPEGYETDGKLLLDLDENDWDIAMNRSAKGFFLSCKYALPYLISRQGARIIAIDTGADDCDGQEERSLTAFVSSRALKAAAEHLETELSYYGISVIYKPACGNWIEEVAG